MIEQLQQYELIVDSEEQDRERPSDYKTQKKYANEHGHFYILAIHLISIYHCN